MKIFTNPLIVRIPLWIPCCGSNSGNMRKMNSKEKENYSLQMGNLWN